MEVELISLQVGLPQERISSLEDGLEKHWTSGIVKNPVRGRLCLNKTQLDGDGQADLKNHGGKDKAVCCYAAVHYPEWRAALGLDETAFPYGAFGENFTLSALTEENVCVGDTYTIGTARVQVSQPRMPCWKLGRRWDLAELPGLVRDTGRTGWYLRVLEPGEVGPGDTLTLLDRPLPDWPLSRINHAMYVAKDDDDLAYELGRLPLLAEGWRSPFRRRAGLIHYRRKSRVDS